jgi:hypothetical protein
MAGSDRRESRWPIVVASYVSQAAAMVMLLVGVAGCSPGAPSTFTLKGASVDPSYACPAGATDAPYSLHGVIDVRNGTSSSVTVKSVTAVMTLSAVKGQWLEKVGERYEAAGVTSSVTTLAAGSSASMQLTIPSTCTNGKTPSPEASYGEYSVGFTVTTSSGTYRVESSNRHRIVAA